MDSSWLPADPTRRSVTPENATYLGPVFSAIRHIVDFGSTLPVRSSRDNGDGTQTATALPQLLRSQMEPGRYGIGQWIGQALYGIATVGNAVGWIVEFDGFGLPRVVRWLQRADWSFDELRKQWYVAGAPVPASRLLHIPWIVPPGFTIALSPIEHYAAVVRAGLSAQEYADVKRGGGIPPTILRNAHKTLLDDDARRTRAKAEAAFASGRPFVTGADWDLSIPAIPPSHAMFVETLKLSAKQVAAIYGIDPREIGGEAESSLTYSTDESRSLNRANNLRPYLVRIEDAIDRVLPEKQSVKFNVDATIRTDIKTRVDVLGSQIADGRLSVNEARDLEDRPAVPGGDYHNVPAPKADPTIRMQGETP